MVLGWLAFEPSLRCELFEPWETELPLALRKIDNMTWAFCVNITYQKEFKLQVKLFVYILTVLLGRWKFLLLKNTSAVGSSAVETVAAVSQRLNTPQKIPDTLVVVKRSFTYFLTFRLPGQSLKLPCCERFLRVWIRGKKLWKNLWKKGFLDAKKGSGVNISL